MSDIAPHDCPECGGSAYVGLNQVECVNPACRHWHDDTYLKHRNLTDDGQEEIGLSLSDYLFEYDTTPVAHTWTFPTVRPATHWVSTLVPLPAANHFQCDPLWIHQAHLGQLFVPPNSKATWMVTSLDRSTGVITADCVVTP